MAPALIRPASLAEARAAMRDGAIPVAGATALMLAWRAAPPARPLLDLSGLDALRGIAATREGFRIGALTTLEAIRRHEGLARALPALASLLRLVGTIGVRAQGTVGGNLAWGSGDLEPLLLSAGATQRSEDGLLEEITLPAPDMTVFAEKVGHRAAASPTLVTVAGAVRIEKGRIAALRLAVGGGPTSPQRLHAAEEALLGRDPAALDWRATGREIAATIQAGEDALAPAAHRAAVAGRALAWQLAERAA